MEQKNDYLKGLFIGSLMGGLVGSAIALLYASKSGKELRKDIVNKVDEYYDDAEKFVSDAQEKANNSMNDGKKILHDAKIKIDSIVSTGKEVVTDEIDKLKTSLKAGVDAYKKS